MMHPHRHAHLKQPGQKGGAWHQDGRSKHFTTKDHGWLFEWRRHHRFRSVWAWYYPQEVTEDMGPTAVIPGVQYYDLETMRHYNSAYTDPELGALLCGQAGTITIGHYHQWHSSWGTNHSNKNRYMIKFLLTPHGRAATTLLERQRHYLNRYQRRTDTRSRSGLEPCVGLVKRRG